MYHCSNMILHIFSTYLSNTSLYPHNTDVSLQQHDPTQFFPLIYPIHHFLHTIQMYHSSNMILHILSTYLSNTSLSPHNTDVSLQQHDPTQFFPLIYPIHHFLHTIQMYHSSNMILHNSFHLFAQYITFST